MSKLPTLFVKGNLYPRMGEKQEDLDAIVPIEYLMQWFDSRIPNKYEKNNKVVTISDRIIILQSGTGSAKSTAIAPNLYLRFFKRYRKGILITQPSVLTTVEIPKTIASIPSYMKPNKDGLQIELYKNLGHQTKEFVRKPIKKGILFSTVGILLQFLKIMTFAEFRKKYQFILIDECHVRQIDLDITMSLLKKLVNDNIKEAPFIVFMSATFDTKKYANYFNTTTIFEVKGKSYDKIENYQLINQTDVIQSAVDTVEKIHLNDKLEYGDINDILIFVSSSGIGGKIIDKLNDLNKKFDELIIPIPLDSSIFKSGDSNYRNLFTKLRNIKINKDNKTYSPVRRVIVSTNIAETGLTLETLKYCIDTGFVISVEYNPNINCTLILNKPVTQSMAIQRKGRIGRVRPGIYYAMFTKSIYDSLIVDTMPSIITEDTTITILNIINKITMESPDFNTIDVSTLDQFDLTKLDLMDDIPIDSLNNAIEKLYILGMIHRNGYPTKLGLLGAKYRKLNIENIKLLLSGFHFDASILDLITIVAFLSIGKNKIVMKGFKNFIFDDCSEMLQKIMVSCEFIDFVLFFNRFTHLMNKYKTDIPYVKEWCEEHFVSFKSLLEVVQFRDDLINETIFSIGLNPYINANIDLTKLLMYTDDQKLLDSIEIKKIKKCIYEGYKLNVATLTDNRYISDRTHVPIKVKSYLTNEKLLITDTKQTKPKKILYNNLILSGSSEFEFSIADGICVLDGFVHIDNTFINS